MYKPKSDRVFMSKEPEHIASYRKEAYKRLNQISDKWKNGQPNIDDRFIHEHPDEKTIQIKKRGRRESWQII